MLGLKSIPVNIMGSCCVRQKGQAKRFFFSCVWNNCLKNSWYACNVSRQCIVTTVQSPIWITWFWHANYSRCWYCELHYQLSVTNWPAMASLMRPKPYISVRLYCGFSNIIFAKFMGPTWGPPGPHMGPMLAPWTLLSGILAPYIISGTP